MSRTDKHIAELVLPKYRLQKCYNYYNGVRDAEQFRYLEENYGIGNPTAVTFTPLVRKHIDALIGEYLDIPKLPKVSCKDKETISKITRDKELEINTQVFNFLQSHLNNNIMAFINGQDVIDRSIEDAINKLIEDINNSFISDYEIAAQNIVEYVLQSRSADLLNKLSALLLDLLVSGTTFYRVKPSVEGNNIEIEDLHPLNTFVERNPNSIYVKDSPRAVIRKWYTKQEILSKYGQKLGQEAIKDINDLFEGYEESSYVYVRSFNNSVSGAPLTDGLQAGLEVVPGFPFDYYNTYNYKLIPVYEVEWIEVDKVGKEYVMNRYETVRISDSVYILTGKSENVIRTKDNPNRCTLSINGLFFVNRNLKPYSLMEACMELQDRYDLIIFFRDNLFASSGSVGDWVDVSMLPAFLGGDLTERLEKYLAYKKQGIALIDTSQEGRAFNNNTTIAGFDDTVKAQTIQAFELALERIESQCSDITGMFRERLNGINQKDAVTNVQTGIQNSYKVTKQYFQQLDTITTDILLDCLNIGKIVWKKGITGTLILGDKLQKVFTALPEHFTVTDYDINIIASSQVIEEMKAVQQVIFEYIKSGGLDADIVVDALTTKSLTDLKATVSKAFKRRKEENNQLNELSQQNEQLQRQLQELQQQNKQLQTRLENVNEQKLQLEQLKVQTENDIDWFKARTERAYKENVAENDTKRTGIEAAQLYDGDRRNDKVRQLRT